MLLYLESAPLNKVPYKDYLLYDPDKRGDSEGSLMWINWVATISQYNGTLIGVLTVGHLPRLFYSGQLEKQGAGNGTGMGMGTGVGPAVLQ